MTLDDLRRATVARSLFTPTALQRALDLLGFVQANPIRSPARAQDLMLRHRVTGYGAGELERRYAGLDVHEDVLVNYGFVTSAVQALMHPRGGPAPWTAARGRHVRALLDFVRARGAVHPRRVDNHFAHGTVTNYWGGLSSATTHLMDAMHYRGLLRVVRREGGIRIYAVREQNEAARDAVTRRVRLDALVDVVVRKYAPLPAASLSMLVRRLRYPSLTGSASSIAPCSARGGGSPTRASTASTGSGRWTRAVRRSGPATAYSSWRRSIRLYGTGGASRFCGAGLIVSRRTRRCGSGSGYSRCRCSGATASSAGETYH